jgi:hypothetical protein
MRRAELARSWHMGSAIWSRVVPRPFGPENDKLLMACRRLSANAFGGHTRPLASDIRHPAVLSSLCLIILLFYIGEDYGCAGVLLLVGDFCFQSEEVKSWQFWKEISWFTRGEPRISS